MWKGFAKEGYNQMTQPTDNEARKLANDHVEWLLDLLIPIIRRIATEEFLHGFKHGEEAQRKDSQ